MMTLTPTVMGGCALAFAAAFLAAKWVGPAWDQFSERHLNDILPRMRALEIDDAETRKYMRWWGVSLFAVFLFVAVVLQMWPVGLGLTMLIFVAPRYVLDSLIKERQVRLRDQLVRASAGLANTTRAGMALAQGLEKVAADTPSPMGLEFKRIVRDYKAGRPLDQSLRETQERLNLESFTVFASAVNVALERGGKITFALEQISQGLQEMQRLDRKLEADSAAGRKMATVLALFPIFFLAFFTVADYHNTILLYTTLIGQLILFAIGFIVYWAIRWCMWILDKDF